MTIKIYDEEEIENLKKNKKFYFYLGAKGNYKSGQDVFVRLKDREDVCIKSYRPNVHEYFNIIRHEEAFPIYENDNEDGEVIGFHDGNGNEVETYEDLDLLLLEKLESELSSHFSDMAWDMMFEEDTDGKDIDILNNIYPDEDQAFAWGLDNWGWYR